MVQHPGLLVPLPLLLVVDQPVHPILEHVRIPLHGQEQPERRDAGVERAGSPAEDGGLTNPGLVLGARPGKGLGEDRALVPFVDGEGA